jgi:hypothetical protein
MLFKQRTLDQIAAGTVTRAYRRWQRPTVKPGGRLRTAVGELAIVSVAVVAEQVITEADAAQAGYATRAELLRDLGTRAGDLYQICFRLAGPDSRIALRAQAALTEDELQEISRRLQRLDAASPVGPWTIRVLELIKAHPERRAGDLAELCDHAKEWLKLNVRKLKNLGLTESLPVGYRLAPRGVAFLAWRGASSGGDRLISEQPV